MVAAPGRRFRLQKNVRSFGDDGLFGSPVPKDCTSFRGATNSSISAFADDMRSREAAGLWVVSFPLPQIDGARETWGAPNEASLPTVSAAAKDRFGSELSLEQPERIGRISPPDRPARGEIFPPLLPCARKEKSRSRGRAVARRSRTAPSACPQRWWPAATTLG